MKKNGILILIAAVILYLLGPIGWVSSKEVKKESFDIAVFVPGVVAGSAMYEQMVEGAKKLAAEEDNVTVKVIEAGFNQGEWGEKMNSLAATGEYEVILSSNPAMPFVSMESAKNFPEQKWLIVDAYLDGNPQFFTLFYNQVENGYLLGYLAGLITKSSMPGANKDLKVGMVVAQEYPALTEMMKPGFIKGFNAVDPKITLDYRVIGNWYDANKAAELANSMFDAGVDIILVYAGGANQGVIKAAEKRGKYVVIFESNEYKTAPGTIVGCTSLKQVQSVYENLKKALNNQLSYGKAVVVDAADGYVDFIDTDPIYIKTVSDPIRKDMDKMLKKMRSGEISFELPKQ